MKKKCLFLLLILGLPQTGVFGQDTLSGRPLVEFDSHWYFRSAINDSIAGTFIFDTGASHLIFDSLYLARSGYTPGEMGTSLFSGVGTAREKGGYVAEPTTIRFDTLSYTFNGAPVLQVRPVLGRRADGIVGWPLLAGRVAMFDYETGQVTVFAPDSPPDLTGYTALPLAYRRYRYHVRAEAEPGNGKRIRGKFLLDLGSSGAISFTSGTARKYKLNRITPSVESYARNAGVGGEGRSTVFRATAVTIGGFRVEELICSHSHNTSGSMATKKYLGLLGNRLLRHFSVIIDFKTRTLYLKPNGEFGKRLDLPHTGMGLTDRTDICEGFIVNLILVERNAERAGVRPGDIITHVEDRPVTEMTRQEIAEILRNKGATVGLTVRRGEEIFEIALPLVDQGI
ncbi:MAG: PDZ domain-containing protein [Rikenellaceae bacterium]|nr:PDZ domain-containing protein [Rikenellaceae bacterium]